MSNLDLWDAYADIDPQFTKPITGKAYKGTSPNPQYIIKCLTDLFGPVGKGFGWEVVQEGFMPLGEEVLHWCRIRFWHGERDNWFESYGQTKALMKTRNGMMSDEDAPKKSLTDAIVKSASHLGIAANIFLGRWDDQKYVQSVNDDFREKEGGKTDSAPKNEEARKLFDGLVKSMRENKSRADLKAWWSDPDCQAQRSRLPTDWQKNLHTEFVDYGTSLPEPKKEAA